MRSAAKIERMMQAVVLVWLGMVQAAPQAEAPAPAAMPAPAHAAPRIGRASVSCLIDDTGRPTDCRLISENPVDAGFGAEALRALASARFDPQRYRQERRLRQRVTFNIRFEAEQD